MDKAKIVRKVFYNGGEIVYLLERKQVKNLNLRIRRDGSIFVSANPTVTLDTIDQFILRKGEYILSAIQHFKAIAENEPAPKQYVSGESFMIQGRNLRLKVIAAEKDSIQSDGVYIYLSVKDPSNFARKRTLVTRFLNKQCQEIFGDIAEETYLKFQKYGVTKPILRIRNMSTRWGSCLPTKAVITLNERLLEMPRNCIEYVVLHEFAHFIHPNHSQQFYNFVAMLMPDWKDRKEELEKLSQNVC